MLNWWCQKWLTCCGRLVDVLANDTYPMLLLTEWWCTELNTSTLSLSRGATPLQRPVVHCRRHGLIRGGYCNKIIHISICMYLLFVWYASNERDGWIHVTLEWGGSSWSYLWMYGSWIYHYMCNQCLFTTKVVNANPIFGHDCVLDQTFM